MNEIPDVVTIDPEPCPCGRTLKRVNSVHGRSDDVLSLHGVTVHPLQFAGLAASPDVREFQVVQHGDRLTLHIVLGDHAATTQTTRRVHDQLATQLRARGLTDPRRIAYVLRRPSERQVSRRAARRPVGPWNSRAINARRAAGSSRTAATCAWAEASAPAWWLIASHHAVLGATPSVV